MYKNRQFVKYRKTLFLFIICDEQVNVVVIIIMIIIE